MTVDDALAEDTQTSDSGGAMVRLDGTAPVANPDLEILEPLRPDAGERTRAGGPPYWTPGQVLSWRYGVTTDVLRVVRDDARGLVAWLPHGSERRLWTPRDGRAARDRPADEMVRILVERDYDMVTRCWSGPGVVRVTPSGKPWTVVFFSDEDGSFAGYYINLELTHRRAGDGSPRLYTRDLVLDLWLDASGDLWLKDADELEAAEVGGYLTTAQGGVIRELADWARHELIEPRAWPLEDAEQWENWRPPSEWAVPLTLADAQM